MKKTPNNKTGIKANGKYFLFELKLMAFPNGMGCNEFAFCSIEANINSEHSAEFSEEDNFKKCGEVVASIIYDDYKIDVHMPVSGKIISINDAILSGNENIVLQEPETAGYIALIIPSSPYDRDALMIAEKYRMSSKTTK